MTELLLIHVLYEAEPPWLCSEDLFYVGNWILGEGEGFSLIQFVIFLMKDP